MGRSICRSLLRYQFFAPIVFMGAVVLPWLTWNTVNSKEANAEIAALKAREAKRLIEHDAALVEILKGLVEIRKNLEKKGD